jgi:transglutaminase-like putative cysteine protease
VNRPVAQFAPPGLLGFALVFWGWQVHLLPIAIPLALLLESAAWVKVRWEFSTTDYQRLWNGCLVLMLGSVLFAVGYSQSLSDTVGTGAGTGGRNYSESMPPQTRIALLFFQWWPLVFAPFVLAVAFGREATLPVSVFSWIARRHQRSAPAHIRALTEPRVAVGSLYLVLILVAASTSNRRTPVFFLTFLLLGGWGLWPRRSVRIRPMTWVLVIMTAGCLGLAAHLGLSQLHRYLSSMDVAWLQRFTRNRTNPTEARTALGTIGELKLSGRIVLRLSTTNESPPELLREASYDTFNYSTWTVGGRADIGRNLLDWREVISEENSTGWQFATNRPGSREVTVSQFLRGGRGLLPLPQGILQLEDLPATTLKRSGYGSVQAIDAPSLVTLRALYTYYSTIDRPPTSRDVGIPDTERPAIRDTAARLGLPARARNSVQDVLRALHNEFHTRYRYSTYQDSPHSKVGKQTPLSHFLTWDRQGHCEFFATAAVLLLREAGIPARYAVGYSVQESAGPQRYVVRERHAHAWCLYWSESDHAWFNFDPTPPAWNQVESERASFWEPISDLGSRLWFEYAQWRAGRSEMAKYLAYALTTVLLAFLLRLFVVARRNRTDTGAAGSDRSRHYPGLDSEFYVLERALARGGHARRVDETASEWARRVGRERGFTAGLEPIVRLHYRLRFDASGLRAEEVAELRNRVREMLHSLGLRARTR